MSPISDAILVWQGFHLVPVYKALRSWENVLRKGFLSQQKRDNQFHLVHWCGRGCSWKDTKTGGDFLNYSRNILGKEPFDR